MPKYLVSYDLSEPYRYDEVDEYFKETFKAIRVLESVWYFESTHKFVTLQLRLDQFFRTDENFCVFHVFRGKRRYKGTRAGTVRNTSFPREKK